MALLLKSACALYWFKDTWMPEARLFLFKILNEDPSSKWSDLVSFQVGWLWGMGGIPFARVRPYGYGWKPQFPTKVAHIKRELLVSNWDVCVTPQVSGSWTDPGVGMMSFSFHLFFFVHWQKTCFSLEPWLESSSVAPGYHWPCNQTQLKGDRASLLVL